MSNRKSFALKHMDKRILNESSSGGAFSAISDYIIGTGGYVAGAIYDIEDDSVKHIVSNNIMDRNEMRGSKYIQSTMGDVYKIVANLLTEGKTVLYTGTICQVNGLKNYIAGIEVNDNNLYCLDIICHGVASPLIWKSFIRSKSEDIKGGSTVSVKFRDKENGWTASNLIADFKNVKHIRMPEFMKLYYSHTIMRESCYNCEFASTSRNSDITIGDFWGIEKSLPDFNYQGGTSFVLINSLKGKKLFDNVLRKDSITCRECETGDVVQPNFYAATHRSVIKDNFWNYYYKNGITKLTNHYTSDNKFRKLLVVIEKVFCRLKEKVNNEK